MNPEVEQIPLCSSKASPVDGVAFQERLKEELLSLITVSCSAALLTLVCKNE